LVMAAGLAFLRSPTPVRTRHLVFGGNGRASPETIGIRAPGVLYATRGSGRARIYAMRGFLEPHDERSVFIGVRDAWDRFHEIRRVSASICEHPLQ
jgi:hypothetical protein